MPKESLRRLGVWRSRSSTSDRRRCQASRRNVMRHGFLAASAGDPRCAVLDVGKRADFATEIWRSAVPGAVVAEHPGAGGRADKRGKGASTRVRPLAADLPYGTILPSQIGHHEIDRDHARGGIDDPSVSLQVQILCANFARMVSGTRLTVVFCLLSSIPIALAWTTRFSVPWFNSRRSVCRCWHPFRDTHAT